MSVLDWIVFGEERIRITMELDQLQDHIRRIYGSKDNTRGKDGTFIWLVAEVGELGEAVRLGRKGGLEEEIGDCLAWLATLANVVGVRLEDAIQKYVDVCESCGQCPCACEGKP